MAYPTKPPWPKRTVEERFWAHIDRSGPSCWLWSGAVQRMGYGSFNANGTAIGAHRFAMQLHLGRELTRADVVCHTCDNPPCCNPAHLFIGSMDDNIQDKVKKKRHRWPYCKYGHPLTDDNVHMTCQGNRRCWSCHRAQHPRAIRVPPTPNQSAWWPTPDRSAS